MNVHKYSILILDFGSQYVQLIARRIRELGVYCEIYPFDVSTKEIKKFNPNGIILSGGPESVISKKTPRAPKIVFTSGCPVLGICYGMQTMAVQLGGTVASSKQCEFGHAHIKCTAHSKLLANIKELDVWMSHGDQVTNLPVGFKAIAKTYNTPLAAIANEKKNFYGLQFHPEVTHTKHGKQILASFVYDICQCQKLWTSSKIIETKTAEIAQRVGKDQVILGLSGGVDSSVVALLLHKAIGKQLTCILVDTGLLRLNEADLAINLFRKHFGIKVIRVNAKKEFLQALKGITNPEQKRKIIGREFIKIFERAAKKRTGIRWLAQGTIYPDVVESAQNKFGKAHVIKSHHNVGGLPGKMHFKLLEPLRELFKDEVRAIGTKLGLPDDIISQHPFPDQD
jgi:GMP synthase (glutamine-hydrolysing)